MTSLTRIAHPDGTVERYSPAFEPYIKARLARENYKAAQEAYEDAVRRGDKRGQHQTYKALRAANSERLRREMGQ